MDQPIRLRPDTSDYPLRLKQATEKPPVLSIFGSTNCLQKFCLGVVGSRKPLNQTVHWIETQLAEAIRGFDITIVSGGAMGVDQLAHAVAIRARLPTACFLPCGLEHIYPHSLRPWVTPIIRGGGCLISPFVDGEEMRRGHFVYRNKLIAGLCQVLLVIQAGVKSGTMLTARFAQEGQGMLAVVPYFPDSCGRGSVDLICDGATPIRDAQDLRILLEQFTCDVGKLKERTTNQKQS